MVKKSFCELVRELVSQQLRDRSILLRVFFDASTSCLRGYKG
jgi:predicted CopG family antitoxin